MKEGSPVCPLGDEFQIITNTDPEYTEYLTRCGGSDLCNNSEGNDGGNSGGNSGGGSIIVPGASGSQRTSQAAMGGTILVVVAALAHMM